MMREAVLLKGENMPAAYDIAKQKMNPDWPLTFGKEQDPIYNTHRLSDSYAWTFQAFQYSLRHSRKVLDYLDICYVFGKNQFKDFKKISGSNSPVEISENPTALPKWFSVERAVVAAPAVEDDFSKADKESMDYEKECFINDPSKAEIYHLRKNVTNVSSDPNEKFIVANGNGKALLISSEVDYPGWRTLVSSESYGANGDYNYIRKKKC